MKKHAMSKILMLSVLGWLAMQTACAEEESVATKVGDGIKKGAEAAGSGIEKGADAAGRGVKKGVEATGRGLKKAGEWIEKKAGGDDSDSEKKE